MRRGVRGDAMTRLVVFPLVFLAMSFVIALFSRAALLPLARTLQARYGFSDEFVTELSVGLPLIYTHHVVRRVACLAVAVRRQRGRFGALRSRAMVAAALWPGAPVTPPPGWAPAPQW